MTWLSRLRGGGEADEPAAPAGDPHEVAQVEAVLETLRPYLAADGGDVQLVAVEEGWVRVRLRGACSHCHVSPSTVRGLLEPRLRAELGWVLGVEAV